ncbi:unnamed protein product [Prorocentrum cordatum]|uniref:Uncharacterized protein n=1 Tax=Prorocentrum cordatum TaxID=2364126 RepID=A0ABN9V8W4_9DINO|nr:unnamed protein product [Polarella glacialis]
MVFDITTYRPASKTPPQPLARSATDALRAAEGHEEAAVTAGICPSGGRPNGPSAGDLVATGVLVGAHHVVRRVLRLRAGVLQAVHELEEGRVLASRRPRRPHGERLAHVLPGWVSPSGAACLPWIQPAPAEQ